MRDWLRGRFVSLGVIWLAPLAYAVHVLEEALGFPQWVTRQFGVDFTQDHFRHNYLMFLTVTLLLALPAFCARARIWRLLFLAWFSGLFFHNALFHIGATLFFQDVSPGLISSVIIYLPLTFLLLKSIPGRGDLSRLEIGGAILFGGVAHYAFIWADLFRWDRIISS